MTSKMKILDAAIEVFAEKGKHGITMEEIGAKAGINKAMVYYYYTSKDILYFEVLVDILRNRVAEFENIQIRDKESDDHIAAIERLIRHYFSVSNQDYNRSRIMQEAIVSYPQKLMKALEIVTGEFKNANCFQDEFLSILRKGIGDSTFRNINPEHTFISIIGMSSIYSLMGKAISETFLGLPVGDEGAFLEKRENAIIDLVLYGICSRGDRH